MVTKRCDCYNRDPEESHDVNLIHQNFKFFQNMSIQLARQGVKNLGYYNFSLARRHISYRKLATASTSSVNEEEIKFFSRLSSQWFCTHTSSSGSERRSSGLLGPIVGQRTRTSVRWSICGPSSTRPSASTLRCQWNPFRTHILLYWLILRPINVR